MYLYLTDDLRVLYPRFRNLLVTWNS